MSSSTASRWFAPSHEFYASLDDYAVVKLQSAYIRQARTHPDNGSNRIGFPDEPSFSDYLSSLGPNPCYPFATEGQLVYADVDEENPQHKEDVYGRIAKEVPLPAESESASVKSARKNLIEHLATEWFPRGKPTEHDDDDVVTDVDVDVATNEAQRQARTTAMFTGMLQDGVIDDAVIEHIILHAETPTAKNDLLNIVSSQTLHRSQRPVLVLIDLIDDMQTSEPGVTKGWVIGYEFVENVLIIKPFLSAPDRHPLGGTWYGGGGDGASSSSFPDDGICFRGSPAMFAELYIHAFADDDDDVDNAEQTSSSLGTATATSTSPSPSQHPHRGFKPLIHTIAARWVHRLWDSLFPPSPSPSPSPSHQKFQKALSTTLTNLTTIPFPIQQKSNLPFSLSSLSLSSLSSSSSSSSSSSPFTTTTAVDTTTTPQPQPPRKRIYTLNTFIQILHLLDSEEADLRAIARRAKRAGDEDLAFEVVRVWDLVRGLVGGVVALGWRGRGEGGG